MKTIHHVYAADSRNHSQLASGSIDLVVTSPPYPMIEMWDSLFSNISPPVAASLQDRDYWAAFRHMHEELDKSWRELNRVTRDGAIVCVNVGDATRTVDGEFRLFPNHAAITQSFITLGFSPLPVIIWRKTTNKPNKFMGSGMLPPGAYVTLEHEYILIFRKGSKRAFPLDRNALRYESAYFWEERNNWFSDVWTGLTGVGQVLDSSLKADRLRSAAFPLELAWRLIAMYSIYGDTVLDPFWGTGTTSVASILLGRNSTGFELDRGLCASFGNALSQIPALSRSLNDLRIARHHEFLANRDTAPKYTNQPHGFPVMTAQESRMLIHDVVSCTQVSPGVFEAAYAKHLP